MAARQQQKGTGFKIQYEDLVPKSEWKDEPEATLLTIDLPGFAKEQIKVTYVHTSKMLRVTGERPVTDRRWSRFNEVFIVPQNCLVDKIHGSLKNNVLTITMPKETITKMPNLKLEEKKLLEEAKRKEEAEQFQRKLEEDEQKKKKQLLEEREGVLRKLEEDEQRKKKQLLEEREGVLRKLEEDEQKKKKKLLEEREGLLRKLEEDEQRKKKKLLEEKEGLIRNLEEAKAKQETKGKPKERKLEEEATLEKIEERKLVDEAATQMLKTEDRKLPEVIYKKSGPKSGSKSRSEGVIREVVKSVEEKLGYVVEKEKKMEKGIMEKIRGKEITSEEKKLMVNVGVAALVIFALGAYVSYTFCSSSSSSPSSSYTKPE